MEKFSKQKLSATPKPVEPQREYKTEPASFEAGGLTYVSAGVGALVVDAAFLHKDRSPGMNIAQTTEQARTERSVSEVAKSLSQLLGSNQAVAYVVGIKQARTVAGWVEGATKPADPLMETRLEVAEQLARIVQDPERPWVSKAWLISCNPHIGEDAPMDVIQQFDGSIEAEKAVVRLQFAAESFAADA